MTTLTNHVDAVRYVLRRVRHDEETANLVPLLCSRMTRAEKACLAAKSRQIGESAMQATEELRRYVAERAESAS